MRKRKDQEVFLFQIKCWVRGQVYKRKKDMFFASKKHGCPLCILLLKKKILPKWTESGCCSVMSNSLWSHGLYSTWNSPGQNTEVGSLSLLQGIFPTQGSNPGLPHCRQILYQLSHRGSPRILEWAAYPFSTESSRPRNQTGVSCIAGRFFTNWAIREAVLSLKQI